MGREWAQPLRQALEMALSHGLEAQAGRAYANLAHANCANKRFAEFQRCVQEGILYRDERGKTTFATCLRGERANALEQTGRWDEAQTLCIDLLNRSGASPMNRVGPLTTLA
jgi:hypothetical protein